MRYATATAIAAMILGLGCGSAQAQTPEAHMPPAAKALSVMSATFAASDLDRSIAFYTKGLGLTAAGRMERTEVTEVPMLFPGGGMSLLLMKWKGDAAAPGGKPRIGRLILNVPDLKALAARFEAAGYPLKRPIAEQPAYHILVGLIEDPDGNQLELVQRGP
jgi:catechol 2,3-dioxygenase-like lactoylglutathione lyase family enzyme